MTPTMTTRTAETDEVDAVIKLCLSAFADEAVTAWVIPDPTARQAYLRRTFSASLESVITAGSLILAITPDDAPVAASIWTPRSALPDTQYPEPPTDATADADDQHCRRMAAVETATAKRRPDAAHLHLSSMATLPAHRGRGAGAAMIAAGLARARSRDLPVYLEASTFDNRRLYERAGFRDHGEPIRLVDGGPSLQPMWLSAEKLTTRTTVP